MPNQFIEITITETDLLADRILDTGWYRWRITSVTTEPKKVPKVGENIVFEFECISEKDDQGPVSGVTTKAWIASNSFLMPILKACKFECKAGEKLNVGALVGQEIDGRSEVSEFNGRNSNRITAYAEAGKYTSQKA